MSRSKMVRVSKSFDEFLEEFARALSDKMGRNVTKTEASRILAAQNRQSRVVIMKKGSKRVGIGSEIISI